MADEESQVYPLAPARIHQMSDEVFATKNPKKLHEKRSSKCFVYILFAVVLLSIVALVLALTVLRFKSPEVKLRSVAIKNLRYDTVPLPSLNMTVIAEITVNNMNFGSFKFQNSKASVLYRNVTIGDAKIHSGRVRAKDTEMMDVSMQVRSRGLLDDQNLSSDVNSGLVRLSSYAKLRGEVQAMKIIKRRRTAQLNCTMTLNLTSQAIQDLLCN